MLVYNYMAGEGITHLDAGRPLVVRKPDSRFSLANFMRSSIYAEIATMRLGMDILAEEHVKIDSMTGHGRHFQDPRRGPALPGRRLQRLHHLHGDRRRGRPLWHRPAGRLYGRA